MLICSCRVIGKDGKTVELMSSVDCKGIIGNDNRTYLLDLLNVFPPDVNYFGGAPKEGRPLLSERMQALGYPYTHRHLLSSLRPELLETFCEHVHLIYSPSKLNFVLNNLLTSFRLRTEEFILQAFEELRKIAAESKSDSNSPEKVSCFLNRSQKFFPNPTYNQSTFAPMKKSIEEKDVEAKETSGDEGKNAACVADSNAQISSARDNPVYFAAKRAQIKQAMSQGTGLYLLFAFGVSHLGNFIVPCWSR